jgi:protein-disulfide isomerase
MARTETSRRTLLLAGGAVAIGAAGGGLWWLTRPGSPEPLILPMVEEGEVGAAAGEVTEMALGDPEAPVTIIEYASLTCPHCATFHREVLPQLKEEFIETGQVHYIAREVYFDRPGLWASMLARCAGEDRFFGMLDLLYARQQEWSRSDDPQEIVENLYGIGRQAGMTRERMDACLQDADFARTLVAWYQENAAAHGIQSTPSFVINGERVGNLAWPDFRARILQELEG